MVRGSPGRLIALVALGAVPWTVVPGTGGLALVFPWGLASPDPSAVTLLHEYLRAVGTLPRLLEGWPVSALAYALALASAMTGTLRLEDRRVTGGLLVLAGASHLLVTVWLLRGGRVGVPVGSVLLWSAAWWFHAGDLRSAVGGRTPDSDG